MSHMLTVPLGHIAPNSFTYPPSIPSTMISPIFLTTLSFKETQLITSNGAAHICMFIVLSTGTSQPT